MIRADPVTDPSLEAILQDANDASGQARNVYLTFVLVAAYIAITIAGTSDEQLLRVAPVSLPVLDVGLPIVEFYLLVPWLLVVLHLNLLLQLYFLAKRLHPLRAALRERGADERAAWLRRLHGFPFSHFVVRGERGLVRIVLASMVVATVVLFPLALLVAAQVRFLPYHDATITTAQRAAILADLGLLWHFWPITIEPGRWWRAILQPRVKPDQARLRRVLGRANVVVSLLFVSLVVIAFSWLVATVPGERLDVFPFLNRNLRLPDAVLLQTEPSPELLRALEAGDPEALSRIRGIDLTNRDLRGADLRNVRLVGADLRGANLEGADLAGADLREADLRAFDVSLGGSCVDRGQRTPLLSKTEARFVDGPAARVEDSDLLLPRDAQPVVCRTRLAHANLPQASLQGARLQLADLVGADLREAGLDTALLHGAQLRGARLDGASASQIGVRNADLSGVGLFDADLRGVDFSSATLDRWAVDRADLRDATLPDGAPLAGAHLEQLVRARLRKADLRGADLGEARLRDADLSGADLTGANLAGAELAEATLDHASLPGADLSGVELRAVRLRHVDLRGATLAGGSFQGVLFQECRLDGASLAGARLQHAHFYQTSLRAADLARARLGGARLYAELGLADLEQIDVSPLPPEQVDDLRARAQRAEEPIGIHDTGSLDEALSLAGFEGPVLCPGDPPSDDLTTVCVGREEADRYAAELAAFACDEPLVIGRIAQRALERPVPEKLSERAAAMRLRDPLTPYGPPLARALLDPACEAAAELDPALRAKLQSLAAEGRGPGQG